MYYQFSLWTIVVNQICGGKLCVIWSLCVYAKHDNNGLHLCISILQTKYWLNVLKYLRHKSKFSIIDKYSAFIQVKSRENMHWKNTDANQTTHLRNLIIVIAIRFSDTCSILFSLAILVSIVCEFNKITNLENCFLEGWDMTLFSVFFSSSDFRAHIW